MDALKEDMAEMDVTEEGEHQKSKGKGWYTVVTPEGGKKRRGGSILSKMTALL